MCVIALFPCGLLRLFFFPFSGLCHGCIHPCLTHVSYAVELGGLWIRWSMLGAVHPTRLTVQQSSMRSSHAETGDRHIRISGAPSGLAKPHSLGWCKIAGGRANLAECTEIWGKTPPETGEKLRTHKPPDACPRQICVWDSHRELSPILVFSPHYREPSDLQDRQQWSNDHVVGVSSQFRPRRWQVQIGRLGLSTIGSMYSISSCDFGHWSANNFVPIGIGTLTGLQSCMLSLFITPSMYFYWLNQSLFFPLSLLIFIPSMKCVGPSFFMSNLEDSYCFTSLIRSMLFPTNNMSLTYNVTYMKWCLTYFLYT